MTIREKDEAHVIDHAAAVDRLSRLRDRETDASEFRGLISEIGRISGYEIAEHILGTESVEVETPLSTARVRKVARPEDVVLVNVLRAATPLVDGISEAIPEARVGFVSASRDEGSGTVEEDGVKNGFTVDIEYAKLPELRDDDIVVAADPMLATGSTMRGVIDLMRSEAAGNPEITVLSVVAAPEGLANVSEAYPDVDLFTVSVDEGLDRDGYIVPGLGDAGDRAFGTE